MEPNIGISAGQRHDVAQILNILLADEFILYTKTRNYHWNVRGPAFPMLHELFEQQYERLNEIVDDVAERVRTFGQRAIGTLAEVLDVARLSEEPGQWPDEQQMVADLLEDYGRLIRDLRNDAKICAESHGDVGTGDFMTSLVAEHEKTAWMLRSSIEHAPS